MSETSPMSLLNAYSNSGFYKASVSKVLFACFSVGHVCLLIPALSRWQRLFVCQVPDSLLRGEWWRLFSSKIIFLDLKDGLICHVLLYHFRLFERRLGSRRFCSYLSAQMGISLLLEVGIAHLLRQLNYSTGYLFVGPIGLVFPWLLPYYTDVPKTRSGLTPFSSKTFTYFAAFHLAVSSTQNCVAAAACLLAGLLFKVNFLWIRSWFIVPQVAADLSQRMLGWLVDSGPPEEVILGATLEIQRVQHAEAFEQHMIQRRVQENRPLREQIGQGFAERLVDDQWGAFHNFEARTARPNVAPPSAAVPRPSEENIRILTDMGFSRDQVLLALQESRNNVQLATAILLRDS